MRFVTFTQSGTRRAGVLGDAGAVCDLAHPAVAGALNGVPADVTAFLEAGLPEMVRAISAHGLDPAAALSLADVELHAPLVPKAFYALAFNYRDALAERGMAPPEQPVLFMKAPSSVVGPDVPVLIPPDIGGCTYEVEIAAVIGRRTDKVSRADALGHVAGYTIFNDISASEMIKREGSFARGKNLPTFGPLGPYLASADEVADPHDLRLSLEVDGITLQDGHSADLVFDIADLIAILSQAQPLEPGDVIATGTPAGVAGMRKPPAWLKPGSMVRARVDGLGVLENPIRAGEPHGV
ncbi:fumarylacetoacetate hydrolase family protein [Xanthobacteraceae bacterium A53D]